MEGLSDVGRGLKFGLKKKQIPLQEGTPWRGMELKVRRFKREKAQTISRPEFQTQKKNCQERGSFKREQTQGGC
jgi:hypothetical protein